jgi:penicillin-binding protein 2
MTTYTHERLDGREETPGGRVREWVLLALVGAGLLVILGRMWYLQVALGSEIRREAEESRTKSIRQMPFRGRIVDRRGRLIATVAPQDVIALVPKEVENRPDTIAFVSKALGIPETRIRRILNAAPSRDLPVPVAVGVTGEQLVALSEERFLHPGVHVSEKPIRVYPDKDGFSHSVGYVGPSSPADVKAFKGLGFDASDFVGKIGVEREREELLHGTPGSDAVEINSRGAMIGGGLVTNRAPSPGATLTLTLDADLQRKALEMLKGRQGAVAAVEPRTGEVLVFASSPSYDANLFAERILPEDWKALRDDPQQPLLNRALQSAYPPGSPFKIITAIAGLKTGVISRYSSIVCQGGIRVGNRFFRCHKTHGYVTFTTAISESCDSFFYNTARNAGPDPVIQTARDCGLGQKSGIDLPNERSGTIPTDAWLKRHRRRWVGGDTTNLAIGQGYTTATPIQMADIAALVANGGVIYRPHILRQATDPLTKKVEFRAKPEVRFRVSLSEDGWAAIRNGMVQCIEHGTGTGGAKIPGFVWAGKTGSAEHGRGTRTHAWFIGYAPADDPKIAICVLLEGAGHGGDVAAPIAREIVRAYLLPRSVPEGQAASVAQ